MAHEDPGFDTIFAEAIEIPSAEGRAAFLARSCGEDEGLRRRLYRLIEAHFQAGSFLESPPAPPTDLIAPTSPIEAPGTFIGPYKLLQQIGEGGMGVVYMAEQEQPVRRRVALKVIKPGMDTAQVVARFEAERQALALMDHPNIARVLDAGATESGRPYFVMELVNGIPITEYCDQARLTPRARLELFVPVCRAIQHAHQKGVIHRDIKPSNVMITLVDGQPTPRVIDFGVAKATGQRLTERSLFTQFGAIVGTLEYMSPEQAELSALDVDTRSDVFSLGVLLYELLTGSTPLERSRLREAGFAEILRRIREEEPPTPSTRLSGSGEALPSIAASRHTEPTRLARLVRGELDWIAMRALEKDRTRRYDSASSLAADVERYLADEAVEACPPSRRYRLGKFARKHRAAFATAGFVAAVLVATTAFSAWQAVRARTNQIKAEAGEARATKSDAESRAVLGFFLNRVVAAARPAGQAGGRGHDVTLRAALDAAERDVAADFATQPGVEAIVRKTLGESYFYLGDAAKAVKQFERVRSLNDLGIWPVNPNSLALLDNLTVAYFHAGRTSDAIRLGEEMVERRRSELGPQHPETLRCMSHLATMYREVGRIEESVRLSEDSHRLRAAALGPDNPDTLESLNTLAVAYADAGRIDDAIRLCKEALERRRAKLGPDHPETLQSLGNLATLYQNAGRLDDSIRLQKEGFDLRKAKLGTDHPDTLTSMNNLASAYHDAGRVGDATKLQEEVVAIRKAKLGPEHFSTLQGMINLASMYLQEKRWAEAEALAVECLELLKKAQPDDWRYFLTMSQLGMALTGLGRYAEAEPHAVGGYEGLKARVEKMPVPLREKLAENLKAIVRLYEAWGKPDKAEEWRRKTGPGRR
jgi:serine/threonine protein kinase